MLAATEGTAFWAVVLACSVIVTGLLLWRIGVPFTAIHGRLRQRFIWGIPWGTAVVVVGLFVVYLFVQRGFWHWRSPVVVAFTASWMWDPVGWVLAAFSHASPGHLRNNVTSLLVFGPIVEWIWGHYPRANSDRQWPDWSYRPAVRAFILFPTGIAAVGVVAALFSWGPVIGFSVAGYALVGIVLVHYPILAIVGLVARGAVRLLWRTVTDPVQISEATVRVVEPSWFGSAVQGHLVGLLLGVLIGLWLLHRSARSRPTPGHAFVATGLAGASLSLWGIWWILGPGRFILFRAAGVMLILGVAVLVAVLVSRPIDVEPWLSRAAFGVLVLSILCMGVVGIGLNLAVADPPPGEPTHIVADYEIYYGEEVPDGMVNIVDIEAFGLTTDVRTSGVIVVSEERGVWRQPVSATELRVHGDRRFHVGGLGWSEEVYAVRRGWIPVGGEPVYTVWIGDGTEFNRAFTSDAQMARPVVANHSFAIAATNESFNVLVEYQGEFESVRIPGAEESRTVHEIELHRVDGALVVRANGTDVPIASPETYD